MKNRAKCKLCESVIESFHQHDFVSCKCGEISIDGGTSYLKSAAKNYENFLRVDDEGNEIVVTYKEKGDEEVNTNANDNPPKELTKKELVEMLDAMIKNIENLPQHAMLNPITHYDLISFMLVLSSILKKED
jgi:hypothetical protein